MNILLVEDNLGIQKGLGYSLTKNNYNVIVKSSIKDTKAYLQDNKPTLIILDIALPDGSGLDLYKDYIKFLNINTIFLTADDNIDNIVFALDTGACDYITKPFEVRVLIAKINRILSNKSLIIKNIVFDFNKMEAFKNNNVVSLTSLEKKILFLLVSNKNKVVTRENLINYIWELTGNDVSDNTLTVYLKRIREKLDTDIIKTIKGIGYRIDEE